MTLYAQFRAGWTDPAAVALDDGSTRLDYGALDAAAGRTAAVLQAMGLCGGDRIGLAMPKIGGAGGGASGGAAVGAGGCAAGPGRAGAGGG